LEPRRPGDRSSFVRYACEFSKPPWSNFLVRPTCEFGAELGGTSIWPAGNDTAVPVPVANRMHRQLSVPVLFAPCFGHVTMFSHTCGLAWLAQSSERRKNPRPQSPFLSLLSSLLRQRSGELQDLAGQRTCWVAPTVEDAGDGCFAALSCLLQSTEPERIEYYVLH
jgi:hypothetical protein